MVTLLTRLCRAYVLARWRRHSRAERLTCAGMPCYAIGLHACDREALHAIADTTLLRAREIVAYHLGLRPPVPSFRVPIVVVGSGVAGVSSRVLDTFSIPWLRQNRTGGAWFGHLNTIVIIPCYVPIARLVVHEYAHALFDAWSNGFRWPFMISEGFAFLVEHWCSPARVPAQQGTCRIDCPLSFRDLLNLDVESYLAMPVSWRTLPRWVITFLGHVPRDGRPLLYSVIRGLWNCNACTPERAYEWIVRESRLEPGQLEKEFRRYCSGDDPRPGAGGPS